MATDSADLRRTWWLMAEVSAVGEGGEGRKSSFKYTSENKLHLGHKRCVWFQELMFGNLTLIGTKGTGAGGSVRTASTDSAPRPTSRALIEIDWRSDRRTTLTYINNIQIYKANNPIFLFVNPPLTSHTSLNWFPKPLEMCSNMLLPNWISPLGIYDIGYIVHVHITNNNLYILYM